MKNNKHCGSEFPGMNEFSEVMVNVDEVRDALKKFERNLKAGRVFFPGDAPFAMKCETLLKNAAHDIEGLSASGRSFTATDKTLYTEDDQPKMVSVDEDDVIAVLDDTKKGLFGSLAKKECSCGTIVTTKGILVYRKGDDGNTWGSGFVTWPSIAVSPECGQGCILFRAEGTVRGEGRGVFPHGPVVCPSFGNMPTKGLDESRDELGMHFAFIAQGKGAEFDYDDFCPEPAFELD